MEIKKVKTKKPKYSKRKSREIGRKVALKITKFRPEVIKKLEEAFEMDCSIDEVCFYAGISVQTYYNWIKKNPELLERLEQLRQKPFILARKTIISGIQENPELALKYMERKRKSEFSLKSEMEVNNNITIVDETIKKINDFLDEKSE